MATEDDTFRVLSRPSFDEMERMVYPWWYDTRDRKALVKLLEENKWTIAEFTKEERKRY